MESKEIIEERDEFGFTRSLGFEFPLGNRMEPLDLIVMHISFSMHVEIRQPRY